MRTAEWAILAAVVCAGGCADVETGGESAGGAGEPGLPEGVNQLAVRADAIEWRACAPGLPEGCEIAVLEGNPQEAGPFTLRFHLSDVFMMPPHTHPKEERVTVLSGRMAVAFGAGAGREDAAEFGPGDYYVNARDAVHSVWADEPSIIQITGDGPWAADFVSD